MPGKKFTFSVAASETAREMEPAPLVGPFADCARKAGEFGYDAMEIHVRDPEEIDIPALRDACERAGIVISAVATGLSYAIDGLCLIHADGSVRKRAVERLTSFVNLARELNAVVLIGRMKGDVDDMARYAASEAMLADGLGRAAAVADSAEVVLALEAVNRYESNYMNTAASIRDFIQKYDIPATRVLLDIFHMNIEETSICACIRDNFDLIGYFHVADSNRMYPGAGHVELTPIFETLDSLGYDGVVSLECLRRPDGDAAARLGMEFLSRL